MPLSYTPTSLERLIKAQADHSDIASLASGGFAVGWNEGVAGPFGSISAYQIRFQRFDASGAKTGAEILVSSDPHWQGEATLAGLSSGRALVAWEEHSAGDQGNIKARLYDSAGSPLAAEFLVNSVLTSSQARPDAAGLASGGFVITWTDFSAAGSDANVKAQLYGAGGARIGSEFTVNSVTSSYQGESRAASLADGGFVIVWQDLSSVGHDHDGYGIKAQIYAADGKKIGQEIAVNSSIGDFQWFPDVAGLDGGGFVVVWTDRLQAVGDQNVSGIRAQIFTAAGARVGSEISVNTLTAGSRGSAHAAATADGGFVFSWTDAGGDGNGSGVRSQAFAADGTKVGAEFTVNASTSGPQFDSAIAVLAGGDLAFSWTDTGSGSHQELHEVRAQLFSPVSRAGTAGNDSLTGTSGRDVLDGLAGADVMRGGAGDDTYVVDNAGDRPTETSSTGGTDGVNSTISFALGAHFERLRLLGTAADGTGNGSANVIVGNRASNRLDGGGGADAMYGDGGDDTYLVDHVGDRAIEASPLGGAADMVVSSVTFTLGANVENLILGGNSAVNGAGNALANRITGNAAANILNGGGGSDVLTGGAGDDTYIVDGAGDQVVESSASGGIDTVRSTQPYTLGANVENLVLGGFGITATGNSLANRITGNQWDNRIDGKAGADTMSGGDGNDVYQVDNGGDRVLESSAGGGVDLVRSSVSFVLGAHLEHLELVGTASVNATGNGLANALTGNGAANILKGLDGNDRLDGGAGVDLMDGGAGNDSYRVDNAGDDIVEAVGGGTFDRVSSYASYVLPANVEQLTLEGTAALRGTGNATANILYGNRAANVLDGKGGADTMAGFEGDDVYYVDHAFDKVEEGLGTGIDKVITTVSYTLTSFVERLVLAGSAAINGTGTDLVSDVIVGNSAANVLDGAGGADRLEGGGGDDIYIVDNGGDKVVEASASGGADTVRSSRSYVLGVNVEHLALTGTAEIDGTGNALANSMTGNSRANRLSGGDGADRLRGGGGPDQLTGGASNDRLYGGTAHDSLTGGAGQDGFYFDTPLGASTNVDAIADFFVPSDTIFLDRDIFSGLAGDGTLAPAAFRSGTSAADSDDRILYDAATGRIFYDADGDGAAAAILFAQVASGTALTHADFVGYI